MKFIEEINNYRRISKLPLLEYDEKPVRTILKDVWDMVFAKEVKSELKESILTIQNPLTGKRARVDEQYAIDLTKKDIAELKGTDLEIFKSLNDNLVEHYGITAVAKSLKTSFDLIKNKSVRLATEDYVLERCFRERSAEISDELIRLEDINPPSSDETIPKDIDNIIKNQVDKLPEGGPFFDESLPLLEDYSKENVVNFLENKGKQIGINQDKEFYQNAYDLAMKAMQNSETAMNAMAKTTEVLGNTLETVTKKIETGGTPPISEKPKITGWNKFTENIGKLYGKGATKEYIANANKAMTILQIVSIILDTMALGEFGKYKQPLTGWSLIGTMATKVVALYFNKAGKVLLFLNHIISTADVAQLSVDAYIYEKNKKDNDTKKPLDIETNKLARLAITADDAKKWVESETNPLGLSGDDFANVKYEEDTENKIVNVYVSGSPDAIKLIKTVRLGVVEL